MMTEFQRFPSVLRTSIAVALHAVCVFPAIPKLIATEPVFAEQAAEDAQQTGSSTSQLRSEALQVAKESVATLTGRFATKGGYLWQYALDGSLREGEGAVQTKTVWVQPPGTPTLGLAFVRLYEATGDREFLIAARMAAEALRAGQMKSGGWQAAVEFEPQRRKKWAYRTDGGKHGKDQSSLDDDKTQSALRFLIALDLATSQQDAVVHEMVEFGLAGLIANQLPCGAFPQVYPVPFDFPGRNGTPAQASFPETWPKTYQGHGEYWYKPTLNDNLAGDVVGTLVMAHAAYGNDEFLDAAVRFGEFLIRAQLPQPQPAWAQQYSYDLHPIWARKFEPAAVTGGESQDVMMTLMDLYELTGRQDFLEPIPRAIAYLDQSRLANGKLARFYELETNKPLYFDRKYNLTYDDSNAPTHYSFEVASQLDRIQTRYQRLAETGVQARAGDQRNTRDTNSRIQRLIDTAGKDRVWASSGRLRFNKVDTFVVDMKTVASNLTQLAEFLSK